MENGHHDVTDDIFDPNIDEIDERETPRWEMSEEEPDLENEPTIMNHVPTNKQVRQLPTSIERPAFNGPILPRSSSGPTADLATSVLPGNDVRCIANNYPHSAVVTNGITVPPNMGSNKSQEIVENGHTWDDEFEKDSVKDFGGQYREQEAKYMERTNDAIYTRAAEEHIRQPNPYDDDDSVKNFGGTSHGISRIPSDENLCLSPPWFAEDDGVEPVEEKEAFIEPQEAMAADMDDVISRAKTRADCRTRLQDWEVEVALDFTKNFAAESSYENSRRPSSEDISLTPPWFDTDKDSSCKDYDDVQEPVDIEAPSAQAKVPATGTIIPALPTMTTAASTKERLSTTALLPSTPGLLPPTKDISMAPSARLATDVRPGPNRLHGVPTDPPAGVVPYTPNPQMPGLMPQRRLTPPGITTNRDTARELMAPQVTIRTPQQQRTYEDARHNPTLTTDYPPNDLYQANDPYPANDPYLANDPYPTNDPYPVNNPYPPNALYPPNVPYRARPPQLRSGYRPVNRSGGLEPSLRGLHPRSYNAVPGISPRQFRPKTMNANMVPNRSQTIPSGPLYSQSPRTVPIPSPAVYGARPRMSQGNGPRMMVPRQALNGYDQPYGNQAGNWQYQVMPGQHPNEMQKSLQIFPGGYVPPSRPAAHFVVRCEPTNFNASAQRNMPVPEVQYTDLPDESLDSASDASPVMSTRSESHTSLNVCYTPHPDGLETASVMSFASGASTHQDLDSKIDQVRNLLAVIDTRDSKEMAQTLFSLSNSKENCQAMRQSGCLPLLVQLQHKKRSKDPRVSHEVCVRSSQAMRNIITAGVDDRRGRRELRVLKLLEIVRAYCIEVRYVRKVSNKIRALEQALAAIMKLSFEEEHRAAIGELGGVEAIGEFLEVNHTNSATTDENSSQSTDTSLRKYVSMTLTNMTFGNTKNKALLGNNPGIVKALLKNLGVLTDEDLVQVSASVLRNLSCKADERSKTVFQECNAVGSLMTSAQKVSGESALRTIMFAVWNLSAHSSQNKTLICETPGALAILVKMLTYKSASGSLSVVESSGGILRNLSSHAAVKSEYRMILREKECFKVLLSHLRSPSLRIVSNACGTLWNLSARCQEDQEQLWKLGAVSLLKSLVSSKNKSIAKGAGAAIKNLQNFKSSKPISSVQTRDSADSRKQNGSPSQTRARENHLGGSSSRSRDMYSLNSFTGSADDMTKESGRKSARLKDKVPSGHQNGEADPTTSRTKGVRWVDDKTNERRSGKEAVRKSSTGEKKRSEVSSDEQPGLLGGDTHAQTSREKRDDVSDTTTAVAQMILGEKSRGGKKSERSYSPKTKKKSSSKNRRHVLESEELETDHLMTSQDAQSPRLTNASGRQGSGSARRNVYSDAQRSDGVEKISGRFVGKQMPTKSIEVSEGRGEHGGRTGTSGDRDEDTEVPRSETSEDDSLKGPAVATKSGGKNARVKAMDDGNEDKGPGLSKKAVDLSFQRCQCPEDDEVWKKRSKVCDRCQRRRVSHSSESTNGSRRSSYESLPSSSRQTTRKEPATNGIGYVTTL